MARTFQLPPEEQHRQAVVERGPMKAAFQANLEGFCDGRLELTGLKVVRFAHQPDERQISLSYDLRVKDTRTGRSGAQRVFAIVALDGAAAERYASARQAPRLEPDFGPAVQLLPDLDMIVWGFPNDPELPQLCRLLDREQLEAILREHWEQLGPPRSALARVDTEVIKAVALRRCTMRHELSLADGSRLVVYGKTFGERGSAEQLFRTMAAVFAAPVCRSGLIATPEPLFVVPELEVVFIGDLGGVSMRDDIGALEAEPMGTAIGRALAGIHGCTIEGLPERPGDDALRQAALALAGLARLNEPSATRLAAVVDALAERAPRLTPVPLAPIHGAFRIAQLLLVDDQLALIDFDGFSQANPITDVGGFVANLLYLSLRRRCTLDEALALARSFCRAYAREAEWGLPPDQLVWQTVGHLVGKHVKRSVKTGKSQVRELVEGLLTQSEALLAGELVLAPEC